MTALQKVTGILALERPGGALQTLVFELEETRGTTPVVDVRSKRGHVDDFTRARLVRDEITDVSVTITGRAGPEQGQWGRIVARRPDDLLEDPRTTALLDAVRWRDAALLAVQRERDDALREVVLLRARLRRLEGK